MKPTRISSKQFSTNGMVSKTSVDIPISKKKNQVGRDAKTATNAFEPEDVASSSDEEFFKNARQFFLGDGTPSGIFCPPKVFAITGKGEKQLNTKVSDGIIQSSKEVGEVFFKDCNALDKVWDATFPNAIFYALLDVKAAPVKLGSLKSLKDIGITGPGLVNPLLSTQGDPERSMVLFSSLLKAGLLECDARAKGLYISKIDQVVDDKEQRTLNEIFVVDTSMGHSSVFLKALLNHGASPNAAADDSDTYALEVAEGENLRLLLKFGGDRSLVPELRLDALEKKA